MLQKFKLTELRKENKILFEGVKDLKPYRVLILSNITVNQMEIPFVNVLRSAGLNASIEFGDYNNIINESKRSNEFDLTIIAWDLCNLIEGLQFKANLFDAEQLNAFMDKVKSEIDIIIQNVQNAPMVLISNFTALPFTYNSLGSKKYSKIASVLNEYLKENITKNCQSIDVDKVLLRIGLGESIDLKLFNLYRNLYTQNFYWHLSKFIIPFINSATGRIKKVLILDCDNTLWKGVVGEDGINGIKMSLNSKDGAPFAEVHGIIQSLIDEGILVCLCSKNNFDDVVEVFNNHADMALSFNNFIVKKINWDSKAKNILEISKELNLGLDSFIFVDDSDFEVNLIRKDLPEVTVLQVPEKLYKYPSVFREMCNLFYKPYFTTEDRTKVQQYKSETLRNSVKNSADSLEDYIRSLELEISIYIDSEDQIERISQMTQKTNQFNFTTKRYTVPEILNFIKSQLYSVFTFSVKDKFGDYGIVGLMITERRVKHLHIDSLLMSCRVIGRNVEFAFINFIVGYLKKEGFTFLHLDFVATKKNSLVKMIGEKWGFELIENSDTQKKYSLNLASLTPREFNYIGIKLFA